MSASNLRPAVIARRKAVWLHSIKYSGIPFEGFASQLQSLKAEAKRDPYGNASLYRRFNNAEEYAALAAALDEYRNDPTVKT